MKQGKPHPGLCPSLSRQERVPIGRVRQSLLIALSFLFVVGCKSPFDRTKDASNGGATGTFTGSTNFVIFNNELVSGGGAFEYPGSEGQSLSFNDTSNPVSRRSIRYSWTGEPVSNPGCSPNPTHNFAGFDLMHTAVLADYNSTPGKDLRQAGYTKATFYARGGLSTNTLLKVEVASQGSPAGSCAAAPSPCVVLSTNGSDTDPNSPTCTTGRLTGSWQSYTIPVTNSDLASVKDLFKATFVFIDPFVGNLAPGQGGTAYFDVIQYQP
jgi:hypothetical protein